VTRHLASERQLRHSQGVAERLVCRTAGIDVDGAIDSLRVEPEELASVQPGELSELVSNYEARRVKRFLNSWLQLLEEANL